MNSGTAIIFNGKSFEDRCPVPRVALSFIAMLLHLLHGIDRTNFHAPAALNALGRINDRFLVNHADRVDYTYTHAFTAAVAA
jgi:hypothetical protein